MAIYITGKGGGTGTSYTVSIGSKIQICISTDLVLLILGV